MLMYEFVVDGFGGFDVVVGEEVLSLCLGEM